MPINNYLSETKLNNGISISRPYRHREINNYNKHAHPTQQIPLQELGFEAKARVRYYEVENATNRAMFEETMNNQFGEGQWNSIAESVDLDKDAKQGTIVQVFPPPVR